MYYAAQNIAFLAGILLVSALLGRGILGALRLDSEAPSFPAAWLAVPVGIGASITLLFALAAVGALTVPWILATFAAAAAAATSRARRLTASAPRRPEELHACTRVAAVLGGTTVLLLALSAPLEWDALAYHLPYARAYAEAGGLVVETRLRYPLQAHNAQLLYAAALQFAREPAAQLLHAACGAVTAVGLFLFARSRFGNGAAWLSTLMFASTAGALLDAAYVDLVLAMFAFSAFAAVTAWLETRKEAWLLLAAALLGLAAGTKYQALVLLPVYALAVALAKPGWRQAARAAAVLCATGSWWYLRNAWLAGDPVHPLGGPWLGFLYWDAADLAAQYADVASRAADVPWELLPALAFPFLRGQQDRSARALAVIGLGGLAAWWLSSGYERYLLPSYAPLALMSAAALAAAGRRWLLPLATGFPAPLRRAAPWLGLALLTAGLGVTVARKADEICLTERCVERVYDARLESREASRATLGFAGLRLYQLGLENEYYVLGADVAGDWFGPYRYRDVLALSGDSAALAAHLRRLGRDSLLVNRRRAPFDAFAADFRPGEEIEESYRDERVILYRLR